VFQHWLFWPLFAAIMGFGLSGGVFWGLDGPNTTIEQADAAYEQKEQKTAQSEAKSKIEEADEALAKYTYWLIFHGSLGLCDCRIGCRNCRTLSRTGARSFRRSISRHAGLYGHRQSFCSRHRRSNESREPECQGRHRR
jgi:hypothetical protein